MKTAETTSSAHIRRRGAEKGSPRLFGRIARINPKGYGFIRSEEALPIDYYVAVSSLRSRRDWREGQRVSFVPGESADRKAPPAFDVAGEES